MLQSYPRSFRPSGGWSAILTICSLLCTVGGAAGTWYFGTGHDAKDPQGRFLLTGLSILFFGLGVYLLLSLWRSKIVLTEDRIEIHELTRVRSLQKSEIRGWRLVPTAYMAVLELVPRDPHVRKLKVAWLFKDDETFSAWMDDVPNLDAEEQEKAWKEAANDPEIGPSPQDRVEAIGKASGTARILSGIAIGIAIWCFVYPYPYRLLMIILVAMPWLAVWIAGRSHGLFRLDQTRNDVRPNVAMTFLVPAFLLPARALLDYQVFEWRQVVPPTVLIGCALCFAATKADDSLRRRWGGMVAFLFISLIYGLGAGLAVNALQDHSPIDVFGAQIWRKQIVRGRSTTYELILGPWGPRKKENRVSVRRILYDSLQTGDTVCVGMRKGRLGIQWYTVGRCNDF